MKKIFTTLFIGFTAIAGFSQSSLILLDENNNVVNSTIIDINIAPSTSHTEEIFVTNTSGSPKNYRVRRTIWTMDAGDATQFCWGGLCYAFTTNLSSLTKAVNPADTVDFAEGGFHGLFNAGPAMVTRTVHYKFYDDANSADSSTVVLRYNASVGVDEHAKADGNLGNAYPNPGNALISIKYDMNQLAQSGKIVFHDMLGKKVKEVELTDKQGTAKINVSDMNAGVYFYTFEVNDKAIATKKIVISQK